MTSKPKEVYKTIKRSISSTTTGIISNGNGLFSSKSNTTSPKSKWIHPPELLLNNNVEYPARLLGHTEVSSPKGTHVVRDAIHKIKFEMEVNKGITGHSGHKLKKVDIVINVSSIIVQDSKTKIIITNQPLHNVSFVADDKQDKRLFSFIAKNDSNKHECFVFLSDKLAEQITMTIGEAFDLAYQKFIEKNGKELETQKHLIVLRRRIAMLEQENKELKIEMARMKANQIETQPTHTQNQTLLFDLPKPINAPSNIPPPTMSLPLISNPDVGPKLENLRIDKMEDLFDDDFNPRANEAKSKDAFGLPPFNSVKNDVPSTSNATMQFTDKDFEDMIMQVDKKISELHNKFNNGQLEVGATEVGDLNMAENL